MTPRRSRSLIVGLVIGVVSILGISAALAADGGPKPGASLAEQADIASTNGRIRVGTDLASSGTGWMSEEVLGGTLDPKDPDKSLAEHNSTAWPVYDDARSDKVVGYFYQGIGVVPKVLTPDELIKEQEAQPVTTIVGRFPDPDAGTTRPRS